MPACRVLCQSRVLTGRMCRHVQEVVTKAATDALRSLQERRLITWEKSTGLWGPTLLGSAVVASSLDIQDALDYKQVESELHQCSYCKPLSLQSIFTGTGGIPVFSALP